MVRGYNLKFIAICLMTIFIFQISFPTISFALTGGPSQPEVSSFEPIGTTQMVDLYTGDFNYNIPLLNVPGSNGSYPINIAYNAGVGMEQEASWVGLGWNINPGAIVRQMRGIPDDFNGDEVQKEFSMKTDWTLGLSASVKGEVLGAKIPSFLKDKRIGFNMYYNSYRGVGYKMGHNFSDIFNGSKSSFLKKNPISARLSFDSQGGLSVMPSISFNKEKGNKERAFTLGATMTSNQGLREINGNHSNSEIVKRKNGDKNNYSRKLSAQGAGMSLSNPGYIPGIQNPMFSSSFSGALEIGTANGGTYVALQNYRVNYSETRAISKNRTAKAYGIMYQEGAEGDNRDDAIMDFNREKDGEISKESPYTPLPVRTNDVYSIQGQGTGGVFRAFRSDIGHLKDQKNVSNGVTGSLSLETGVGSGFELGADPVLGYSRSYSGPWKTTNHSISQLDRYKSIDKDSDDPAFENFYFKSNGEQTSSKISELSRVGNETPIAFDLGLHMEGINIKPKVKNSLGGGSVNFHNQTERTKRNQHIEYFTKKELGLSNPLTSGKDHHIYKIEVRNPDGNLYSYGLPVYNTLQKDVSFAIEAPLDANTESKAYTYNDKLVSYTPSADNSSSNSNGEDHYFSSTTLPEYTHAHMLTEIKSVDYVDITDNGVSDDDFGFWTKFEYTQVLNYHWRFPYEQNKANYSRGYYSNTQDDKASYSYGKKNLQYLTTVETNTHIAKFELGIREDGYGVVGENGGINTNSSKAQKKLNKISLYSKLDPEYDENDPTCFLRMTPIKEVHFEYDYSLCPGIPSNANGGGKLTLKKIYFTHLNNNKGSLTPYQFTYSNNKSYQPLESDRWGNFQTNSTGYQNYVDNPYTQQEKSRRDSDASNWNLTKIELPSGGTIEVDYESDDYLYVQNKKAQQMMEIIGFGSTSATSLPATKEKLSTTNRRVFFKTIEPIVDDAQVREMLLGIEDMYFKTFLNLKKGDYGQTYKDYVSGYAKIYQNSGAKVSGTLNQGYFDLQLVDYKGKTGGVFKANPIQMAGWRYMRYQRPDIYGTYKSGFNSIKNSAKRLIGDISSIIAGYYNKAKIAGHCSTIDLSADQKSYVRLNSTKKKLGGGHRVKKIKISSGWGSNEVYGQEYSYVQEDGITSSGVAEYEPMTGGDEISLRLPKYYDKKKNMLFKHQDFKEEPYGESYFPGAKVGYSRVVVRNLENPNVTHAQTGVSVNEFFTSIDYPVIVKKANETVLRKGFNLTIPIPLIGNQSFNNNGYSNGYTIIVNDMPGKPKSVATYPYNKSNGKFKGNPVSATYYTYQDKPTTDSRGNSIRELDNKVTVLDAHGITRKAKIGESFDFFIDQAEHSSFSIDLGLQVNANLVGIIPIPSLFPSIASSQSSYRHVITNKVIFRNGVLKSVENITDGASVIATNELYDAETGQVLLTSSDNEHKKEIYNYTYPAHWAYNRMGGAYENYRVQLKPNYSSGSGVYGLDPSVALVNDVIKLGDKIVLSSNFSNCGWVTAVDIPNNRFTVMNKFNTGTNFGINELTIIKSGNANMQSISNGTIVSFENPVSMVKSNNLLKTIFSQINPGSSSSNGTITYNNICDSSKNANGYAYTAISGQISLIILYDNDTECTFYSNYDYNTSTNFNFDITTISSQPDGSFSIKNSLGDIMSFTKNEGEDCFCVKEYPILQASAIEFSEDWLYNFEDEGSPKNEQNDAIVNISQSSSASLNPYYYGQKGVWRTKRSWAYQKNRKQTGSKGNMTRIDIDGQFDFVPFDWKAGLTGNTNWTWASEITKYSPNGYQVENRSRLDIYSSEMYGYENTVVTTVCSNAKYEEIAFDGFETNNSSTTSGGFSHSKQGHLFNCLTTDEAAHTGDYSMYVEDAMPYTVSPGITLISGKEYLLSAWIYTKNGATGSIKVTDGNTNPIQFVTNKNEQIDGWTKIELKFTPSSSGTVPITFTGANSQWILFDDVRISPFNGGMKTFVYNPITLWLIAELDNLNYATFYNYDEEGSLTQIKKETPKGIVTIKQTRNNTQR